MDAPPAMGLDSPLDTQDSAEEPLEEPVADEAPETQGDSSKWALWMGEPEGAICG